jgi:hypothetical protein
VNDTAWWARVVPARTERDDLRPQRVWTLHNGDHAAAIDVKAEPGIGAEVVLTSNSELRKTRLFRSTSRRNWSAQSRTRGPCLSGTVGRERDGC